MARNPTFDDATWRDCVAGKCILGPGCQILKSVRHQGPSDIFVASRLVKDDNEIQFMELIPQTDDM